jgi:Uma2 family endonuclease
MEALNQEQYCTYEEWLAADDNIRSELLNGVISMMAPPSRRHQEVLGELFRQIANYLEGKPCKAYPAPFGVRLDAEKDTVFLPDIAVICDLAKLDGQGCTGSPDFIAEILSPSTSRYDRFTKFNEYLRAGVREYWILDPDDKTLTAHRLNDGTYVTAVYDDADWVAVQELPGCEINLSLVFQETK